MKFQIVKCLTDEQHTNHFTKMLSKELFEGNQCAVQGWWLPRHEYLHITLKPTINQVSSQVELCYKMLCIKPTINRVQTTYMIQNSVQNCHMDLNCQHRQLCASPKPLFKSRFQNALQLPSFFLTTAESTKSHNQTRQQQLRTASDHGTQTTLHLYLWIKLSHKSAPRLGGTMEPSDS